MPAEESLIFGDLGGTHLRLARKGSGGFTDSRIYVVREWPSLTSVLQDYGDTAGAKLVLSFAKKYNPDGVYHLDQAHKAGSWNFTIDDLKRELKVSSVDVLHDFRAMAMALFHPAKDVFTCVKPGLPSQRLRAVIGVGTGIGHALADPVSGRIYDTFGGHFPPLAVTSEQKDILAQCETAFSENRTFIFEEILSGRGIKLLHTLTDTKSADRLFCEFLGLYANTVCVASHAFGGIYLTGGVIDKFITENRFDWDTFFVNFYLRMVPIVDEALRATPIFHANAADTALYGLDVHAGAG